MPIEHTAAERAPRIAVLGNMNNSGFSFMRYFRDMNVDAHLLPFSTDGVENLSHFSPEADTWEYSRWSPFVHPLGFPNSTETVLGNLAALRRAPAKRKIASAVSGYDYLIGSGVAPALLTRIGRRLDIFFPYGIGIEFYGDHLFLAQMQSSFARRLRYGRLRRLQAEGIRRTRFCLNAEMSLTRQSFEEIGKPFLKLGAPVVYNGEARGKADLSPILRQAMQRISRSDLSLFSAARQLWVRDTTIPDAHWPSYTKNSDFLVRGFAQFLEHRPHAAPLLTLIEYGQDVEATKRLATQLGVADRVQWLPIMQRREIMELLSACHAAAGEFYLEPGLLWGGTGWEGLASGRPLIQAFNFTDDSYRADFGHEPPPILDAKSAEQVSAQLIRLYDLPDRGSDIGARSAAWFNDHGGVGLARRWLDLLGRRTESHEHA